MRCIFGWICLECRKKRPRTAYPGTCLGRVRQRRRRDHWRRRCVCNKKARNQSSDSGACSQQTQHGLRPADCWRLLPSGLYRRRRNPRVALVTALVPGDAACQSAARLARGLTNVAFSCGFQLHWLTAGRELRLLSHPAPKVRRYSIEIYYSYIGAMRQIGVRAVSRRALSATACSMMALTVSTVRSMLEGPPSGAGWRPR